MIGVIPRDRCYQVLRYSQVILDFLDTALKCLLLTSMCLIHVPKSFEGSPLKKVAVSLLPKTLNIVSQMFAS